MVYPDDGWPNYKAEEKELKDHFDPTPIKDYYFWYNGATGAIEWPKKIKIVHIEVTWTPIGNLPTFPENHVNIEHTS